MGDDAQARYGAFVLRSAGPPVWLDLGPTSTIDHRIKELHRVHALSRLLPGGGEARWRQLARELDQLLFEPLRPLAGEASQLLIAPVSEICRVPFAALVEPSGRYEVINYTITYLTTGRDLLRSSTPRTDSSPVLILAGPDSTTWTSLMQPRRSGAAVLPDHLAPSRAPLRKVTSFRA